jgi:hypothetical protein
VVAAVEVHTGTMEQAVVAAALVVSSLELGKFSLGLTHLFAAQAVLQADGITLQMQIHLEHQVILRQMV